MSDHHIVEENNKNCKTRVIEANYRGKTTARDAKPCVFPFIFQGKNYTSCTEASRYNENSTAINGMAWCSTKVDENSNSIDDEWGYCNYHTCPLDTWDKECKTYAGPNNDDKCKFPFTYNGKEYNHCITTDDRCGVPWCPTSDGKDAIDMEVGSWGYCNHHCPYGKTILKKPE